MPCLHISLCCICLAGHMYSHHTSIRCDAMSCQLPQDCTQFATYTHVLAQHKSRMKSFALDGVVPFSADGGQLPFGRTARNAGKQKPWMLVLAAHLDNAGQHFDTLVCDFAT